MRIFLALLATLFGLAPLAGHAQSQLGADDYPRAAYIGPLRAEVGGPPSNIEPPREEYSKRSCLVVVNATSLTRIVEFRLNSGEHDRSGRIKWSDNLLGAGIDAVFPKNFLWWYKPANMKCDITVKLVIRENKFHPDERTGTFNLCGPTGPGFFVLRDEALPATLTAQPANP